MQTLGEVARIPDVSHEDGLAIHLIDIGALCSESLVGRHVLIASGSADKGRRMLFPRSPDALGTLCNPMDCSPLGFSVLHISQSLSKLVSIESVMPSNHLILCGPLLLLPSIFPSIRVFSNENFCFAYK